MAQKKKKMWGFTSEFNKKKNDMNNNLNHF